MTQQEYIDAENIQTLIDNSVVTVEPCICEMASCKGWKTVPCNSEAECQGCGHVFMTRVNVMDAICPKCGYKGAYEFTL